MFQKLKESIKYLTKAIIQKTLTESDLEDILFNWQLKLIECDVSYQVAEYIVNEVKGKLIGVKIKRFSKNVESLVKDTIRNSILRIIEDAGDLDLIKIINEKRKEAVPCKIVFVGINGSGKTTTIAKIAYMLKKMNILSVLACSDTFRAGAQEQLAIHARNLGLKMIKHQYGADPAAVAYDAVNYAYSHRIPVVLIDTAGRMQTDRDLMDELRKIVRVIDADLTIFIGDALAGNDALIQAEKFNEEVGIDASILTKIDADVKGGTAISILYATKKPLIYLGVGQNYDDLIRFSPQWLLSNLLGD
ncbi:MAG: signal recognition particle-docking protein FtsY [Candidatus Methanomethylicota archaeon]|uniref:Signal recognition particle-docking protein FtsY n=1 Tax=Thermoproteota archaeon TaxID=2056631 RepID=A0A497ET37_9CREN|nr:MAG: signal recognition particle-docking protein FtsY [Candidatus Verstraetearchaeota archaeon]